MDLGKSIVDIIEMKKLQVEGSIQGHEIMDRTVRVTEPKPALGQIVALEDFVRCDFLPHPSEFLLLILNFYGLHLFDGILYILKKITTYILHINGHFQEPVYTGGESVFAPSS